MKIRSESNSRYVCACRYLIGWIVLIAVSAGSVIAANGLPSVEFVELGFFEAAANQQTPEWDNQVFKSSFNKNRTRQVSTLINLKNNLWQINAQNVSIQVRYYDSSDRLLAQPVINHKIPADAEYTDLSTSWGPDDQQQWKAGSYRVELWLNNQDKIGEGSFQIKSNTVSTSRSQKVETSKIGFYEAGEQDEAPDGWSDSRLRNNFAMDSSRYIYTMVSLKNLQWKIQNQAVKIHLRYYKSDGSLFGDPIIEYEVPSDWEFAELWNGWGWPDPGRWAADRYRVELWLDNREKIGESHFTIH